MNYLNASFSPEKLNELYVRFLYYDLNIEGQFLKSRNTIAEIGHFIPAFFLTKQIILFFLPD